jgi:uncharacterized protein YwqG
MTSDELRARLIDAGLVRYADGLMGLARTSIRLHASPSAADALQMGATRLGGEPDLPEPMAWPSFHERPLSFIAQINLADTAPLDGDRILPDTGLLSFFYDAERSPWGFDPAHSGGWAVLFTPPGDRLVRRRNPESPSGQGIFMPCALRGEVEVTYAPWESAEVEGLGLTFEERLAYGEAMDKQDGDVMSGEGGTIHRLLGHPDPIQGDMQIECQLVTNGLNCGGAMGDDPRAAALAPGAVDWRLLLQVDSDDQAGVMWGDVGRLYYWIRKEDLAARAWDATWLILQCS